MDGSDPNDLLSTATVFTSSTFIAGIVIGLMVMPSLVRLGMRYPLRRWSANAKVFPDATDAAFRSLRVRVVSSTLPVEVRLIRNGTAVQTKTVTTSGASVSFASADLRTGTYSVVASDGQDETAARVNVSRGWSPISTDRPSWASPRCTTPKAAPADPSALERPE